MSWTPAQLEQFDRSWEVEIAVQRGDGSVRPWTPIWVVCADGDVFVRTWYRRQTGWYGAVLRTESARVRIASAEYEVDVEDVGGTLRAGVDDAYRAKYGPSDSTDHMVNDDAAATTLRLLPASSQ